MYKICPLFAVVCISFMPMVCQVSSKLRSVMWHCRVPGHVNVSLDFSCARARVLVCTYVI
jgi:hypothetical protein